MKILLSSLSILALTVSAQTPIQTSKERATSLFDGRSLAGWHSEGDATWQVAGGVISAGLTGDGWLRSDKSYADFVLRVEFRNSPRGNSGIFLRAGAETKPMEKCNPVAGYEVQINNEEPNWATGSIENAIQTMVKVSPTPNRWHKFEIRVQGDHFVIHLDGKKILDGHDGGRMSGFIGLQHHKDMPISFRAISIQSLN